MQISPTIIKNSNLKTQADYEKSKDLTQSLTFSYTAKQSIQPVDLDSNLITTKRIQGISGQAKIGTRHYGTNPKSVITKSGRAKIGTTVIFTT